MKEYVKQIYNEGLGLTFYKPVDKIIKKIKNDTVKKILISIYSVLYLMIAFIISIMLFLFTYPL